MNYLFLEVLGKVARPVAFFATEWGLNQFIKSLPNYGDYAPDFRYFDIEKNRLIKLRCETWTHWKQRFLRSSVAISKHHWRRVKEKEYSPFSDNKKSKEYMQEGF